jgi:hypothetical protein
MIGPESELWDVLRVGDMVSPGVCKVTGGDLVIGWDIKAADGQKGATTTRINEPLKKFSAEFELSNSVDDLNVSDFDLWDAFQDMLERSVSGATPSAMEVYHPDLARNHITAVTLAAIGSMQADGKGGAKVKCDFIEHRPPKPARAAGAGKVATQTKTEGDKKIDAKVAEMNALNEQYKKPAGNQSPATAGDSALALVGS